MLNPTVGSLSSKSVISVDCHTPVTDALSLMSANKISCLVATLHQSLVGIITERDIVVAANWVLGQPDLLVKDIMSKHVLTVHEQMPLVEALQRLKDNKIRHLVVVEGDHDVAGIVTQTDILNKVHSEHFDQVQDVSEIMTTEVRTIASGRSARYALAMMAKYMISCVVGVEKNCPIGMFTERDVVRLMAKRPDLQALNIEQVMSVPVETISVKASPRRAIELMQAKGIRRLVVVNDHGAMEGIVTQSDIAGMLAEHAISSYGDGPGSTCDSFASAN